MNVLKTQFDANVERVIVNVQSAYLQHVDKVEHDALCYQRFSAAALCQLKLGCSFKVFDRLVLIHTGRYLHKKKADSQVIEGATSPWKSINQSTKNERTVFRLALKVWHLLPCCC